MISRSTVCMWSLIPFCVFTSYESTTFQANSPSWAGPKQETDVVPNGRMDSIVGIDSRRTNIIMSEECTRRAGYYIYIQIRLAKKKRYRNQICIDHSNPFPIIRGCIVMGILCNVCRSDQISHAGVKGNPLLFIIPGCRLTCNESKISMFPKL